LAEVPTDRLLTRAASIEPDGFPTCHFFVTDDLDTSDDEPQYGG
jgi:hypothetical protein